MPQLKNIYYNVLENNHLVENSNLKDNNNNNNNNINNNNNNINNKNNKNNKKNNNNNNFNNKNNKNNNINNKFINWFSGILKTVNKLPNPILFISGKAGSGKTLLIHEMIKSYISIYERRNVYQKPNFYYIDIDNKFPLNLYKKSLSRKNQNLVKVQRCRSPYQFLDLLNILETTPNLIKKGDWIIIDSLSELLKIQFSKTSDYFEWKSENIFFQTRIWPHLLRLVIKYKINLIISHQISYSPEFNYEIPYQYKLFEEQDACWLFLTDSPDSQKDQMNEVNLNFNFVENIPKKKIINLYLKTPHLDETGWIDILYKNISWEFSIVQGSFKIKNKI